MLKRMHTSTGPGKGYSIFAGKDASKGLGMSSLKPEDAVSDYSSLDEKELKVLEDWVRLYSVLDVVFRLTYLCATWQLSYYTKRYNIVGKLVK